jgi:hypothetical protein
MAIITMSRGTYSGAKELSEYVAQNLGYKLLSREVCIEELEHCGMVKEKLDCVRNLELGILERMNLEWIHYLACLRAVLSKEAKGEALVYHGNNGHLALHGFPHILSIRVVADIEYRINAVLARHEQAIDRKKAIQIINKIDARRKKWSQFIYQKDVDDVSSYDMVIDLSSKSISDAYDMIHSAVQLPQFQPTPESTKTIEELARAAELRARIAMETDIVDDEIEVEIHDGILDVKGVVHSLKDANELKRFLSSQSEVEKVESHLEESEGDME